MSTEKKIIPAIPNLTLNDPENPLQELITRDPAGLVKEYSAIYFDLPLFQKLIKFYMNTEPSYIFIKENPTYFDQWGWNFQKMIDEAKKYNNTYTLKNNIPKKLKEYQNQHLIMSDDVRFLKFICIAEKGSNQGNEKSFDYFFGEKEPTVTALLDFWYHFKAQNFTCSYPVEPVSYENGTLTLNFSNVPAIK